MEKAFRDLLIVISRPRLRHRNLHPEKLSRLIILFAVIFFFEIVLAGILFSAIGLDESAHKLDGLMDQMSYLQIFFLAVIVAPIFEEFIFRYYLTKPYVLIYGVVLLAIALIFYGRSEDYISLSVAVFSVLLLTGILLFIIFNPGVYDKFVAFYRLQFAYVFYLSAVIFAFIHIFNFNAVMPWYYTPVLVLPQFIIGLFLAYVRIRNSIYHSILIHALNNSIPMLILLLAPENLIPQ